MSPVRLDGRSLTTRDVWQVAHGAAVEFCDEARKRMQANHRDWVELGSPDVLAGKEAWLLGSTPEQRVSNPQRLRAFVESHCAGVGKPLPATWVRALMVARANVLARRRE